MRHDLITLQLFRRVTQVGSIAGAAVRHNMVAPAVSKRLSDLETQIAHVTGGFCWKT
ncbi:LysR family transcriptional regulator [Oceaniovalibus sp. ACAM 378]|uniref:helix-turn-helix domain-containing protein n=1 Tax=Oceaniovalibus sp. ACAM 378 TaxID=2599923 RepID=UPI0011D34AD8|nr:LysR family transcriptional regulator [Oceaniovalibus sp. ACAM 378]TYB90505.1 LysR family transcriptional regulator [Oceaniovalibus sp. ACAM 378]